MSARALAFGWRLLFALPQGILKLLAWLGAWLHYTLDRRHVSECRQMVEWSGCNADPTTTIKGMYFSLWKILPELAWVHQHGFAALAETTTGIRALGNYIDEHFPDQGCVFVTLHLGNWELCGTFFSHLYPPLMAVYKPHRRPLVEAFYQLLRQDGQQVLVKKDGALMPMLRHLQQKGNIGLLMDQNGGRAGVASSFMGRPCKTWDSAVRIAHRAGAPLIAVALVRRPSGQEFIWRPAIEPILDEKGELLVESSVRAMDHVLGELVKEAPEQWLWLGRKWGRNFKDLP